MIGGSSDVDQESMGAFQEFPQVHNYINFNIIYILTVIGNSAILLG